MTAPPDTLASEEASPLARSLVEAAAFLDSMGETGWAAQVGRALRLHGGDAAQLRHAARRRFGGTGSLDDVVLGAANGHPVAPGDERAANARLPAHLAANRASLR